MILESERLAKLLSNDAHITDEFHDNLVQSQFFIDNSVTPIWHSDNLSQHNSSADNSEQGQNCIRSYTA